MKEYFRDPVFLGQFENPVKSGTAEIEIDDILTARIGVEKDVDEAAGMARDDAISEIVNTLKVDD